jgi:hypothetical protein
MPDADKLPSQERWRIAEERASKYAPAPQWKPSTAGGVGAACAGLALAIFTGFARLDADAFAFAEVITIAIFFAVPFAYVRAQAKEHSRAVVEEFGRLKD